MAGFLQQNHPGSIRVYLTDSSGTPVTGLTYADITALAKKAGGSFYSLLLGASEFIEVGNGIYTVLLTALDTDTLGTLYVAVSGSSVQDALVSGLVASPSPAPSSSPTTSTQLVSVFGWVKDASGNVASNVAVKIDILATPYIQHPDDEGILITTGSKTVTTDSAGYFTVDLYTGSIVKVTISAASFSRVVVVPASDANLFDIETTITTAFDTDADVPVVVYGEFNTASNIGVGGVGPFAKKVGVDLQFRNINAGSSKVIVSLDNVNDEIDIDVDLDEFIFNNDKLRIYDVDGSDALVINPGSDLTAEHTLTIETGDTDRVVTFTADASIGGTNTGDQTITLTGDVTGSGTGSFAATVANDVITFAKMQNIATSTFVGRITASTGDPEALTATQATSLLNSMVGDSGSGGTKGLVPAPAAGDAAASKFLKADGTWATAGGGTFLNSRSSLDFPGYATAGDGTTDDTANLQAQINYCTLNNKSLFIPAGVYKITDTVTIGHVTGSATWAGIKVTGEGSGYGVGTGDGVGTYCTIINATAFKDRPAINFQACHGGALEHVEIVGANNAPDVFPGGAVYGVDPLFANWVTPLATAGQYNPYVGIAVDAYSGSDPGSGNNYPGTYGQQTSSYITINDVKVHRFVLGIGIKPSNSTSQGDYVRIHNSLVRFCAVGVSCGGGQSRNFAMYDTSIGGTWLCLATDGTFGQPGVNPKVYGGLWSSSHRLIKCTAGNDSLLMSGIYTESINTLGHIGTGSSGFASPAIFEGCQFSMNDSGMEYRCAVLGVFNGPTRFTSCAFSVGDSESVGIANIRGNVSFDSCSFGATSWTDDYYLSRNPSASRMATRLDSTRLDTANWTNEPTLNTSSKVSSLANTRIPFTPDSRFVGIVGQGECSFTPGSFSGVACSTTGSYTWTAGTPAVPWTSRVKTTVEFTASTDGEFMVGDYLFWPTSTVTYPTSIQTVSLKVSNVSGTTITAEALFRDEEYDMTSTDTTVYIADREWAIRPQTTFTGTWTTASMDIDTNVDPTPYVQVNDFIQSDTTGLPSVLRVTAVQASPARITVSKFPTVNRTAKNLFWGKITVL